MLIPANLERVEGKLRYRKRSLVNGRLSPERNEPNGIGRLLRSKRSTNASFQTTLIDQIVVLALLPIRDRKTVEIPVPPHP
jgi:hypothetical protein